MEGTFPILSEELVSAGWLVTRISFLNTWNSRKSVSKPSPAGSRGRDRAQGKGRKRERGEIGPEVNRHPYPHPHALHAFSPAGLLRGIAGGQVPQGPRDTQLPGESGGGRGSTGRVRPHCSSHPIGFSPSRLRRPTQAQDGGTGESRECPSRSLARVQTPVLR